jgi:uncharacterized membrane protein YphA (DoxX/SURF4 family)
MPALRSGGAPARFARTCLRTAEQTLERFGAVTQAWAPTVARLLLGLVLLWFGYHELVTPGQWTGYVPVLSGTSRAAQVLVLAHGWVLLVIAVALLGGVAPRLAAGIAAVLLLEIVISLSVTGLSDLVLRDVGVLGLAIAVTGATRQRLLLLA